MHIVKNNYKFRHQIEKKSWPNYKLLNSSRICKLINITINYFYNKRKTINNYFFCFYDIIIILWDKIYLYMVSKHNVTLHLNMKKRNWKNETRIVIIIKENH